MMQASHVHFNHRTGRVTAEPHPDGEKFTVTEDAGELEVTAGDDVSVTVDTGLAHVEALTAQPLLVRERGETVEVLTAQQPAAVDAGRKDPQPKP